jgi:hypothetical protein
MDEAAIRNRKCEIAVFSYAKDDTESQSLKGASERIRRLVEKFVQEFPDACGGEELCVHMKSGIEILYQSL